MAVEKIKENIDIVCIAIIVFFIDLQLEDYLLKNNISTSVGIILLLIAGILGKRFSRDIGITVWKFKYPNAVDRGYLISAIILALGMVIYNTWSLYYSDVSSIAWLEFTNIFQPILMSLRAALSEEILFRVFVFAAVTVFLKGITNSKIIPVAVGMLISSLLFGLMHPGFLLSFLYGILLCFIYRYNGLAIAMIIHFVADIVPFIMLYVR